MRPVVDKSQARSAADFFPRRLTLPALRRAAEVCHGCDLYKRATHVVFGEGPRDARLMLVGETAGDEEDLQGRPFVGPAGRLLDEALEAAGLSREEAYVTNVVKHFKWEPRGKRRLHGKPSSREIVACRPWLEAELKVVEPRTIVCLGATAAQALMGKGFRLTQHLGEKLSSRFVDRIFATYHPAAILRAPDRDKRHRLKEQFIEHLKLAAAA